MWEKASKLEGKGLGVGGRRGRETRKQRETSGDEMVIQKKVGRPSAVTARDRNGERSKC